jgi:hypothetical protein
MPGNLCVTQLPSNIKARDLEVLFKPYMKVDNVQLSSNNAFAFINSHDLPGAEAALVALQNVTIHGTNVCVKMAQKKRSDISANDIKVYEEWEKEKARLKAGGKPRGSKAEKAAARSESKKKTGQPAPVAPWSTAPGQTSLFDSPTTSTPTTSIQSEQNEQLVPCPICSGHFPQSVIAQHADRCLGEDDNHDVSSEDDSVGGYMDNVDNNSNDLNNNLNSGVGGITLSSGLVPGLPPPPNLLQQSPPGSLLQPNPVTHPVPSLSNPMPPNPTQVMPQPPASGASDPVAWSKYCNDLNEYYQHQAKAARDLGDVFKDSASVPVTPIPHNNPTNFAHPLENNNNGYGMQQSNNLSAPVDKEMLTDAFWCDVDLFGESDARDHYGKYAPLQPRPSEGRNAANIVGMNHVGHSKVHKEFYGDTTVTGASVGGDMISPGAFCGCINLYDLRIDDSIREIHKSALMDCAKLKNVALPSELISIGKLAFYGTGLNTVSVPEKCVHIGESAFSNCNALRAFSWKTNIKGCKLDKYAFNNCKNLVTVILPIDCVVSDYSFNGCTALEKFAAAKNKSVTDYVMSQQEGYVDPRINAEEEKWMKAMSDRVGGGGNSQIGLLGQQSSSFGLSGELPTLGGLGGLSGFGGVGGVGGVGGSSNFSSFGDNSSGSSFSGAQW